MFVVILFVFLCAFTFAAAAAAEPLTPRPLDPIAVETFARVMEQSETTRSLVRVIEGSNVIVHIVATPSLPASVGGRTRLVTSRGGYRYVRITISADLPLGWRTAILARELRAASDIARSRPADDGGRRALQAEPVAKFDH
jgi:hypothetical protein